MQTSGFFPVLIADDPDATRTFYTTDLGFQVVFANEWYLHMVNDSGVQVGFLRPNQPTQPEFLQSGYPGRGVLYTLEVADAAAAYAQLRAQGVPLLLELRDEPWGATPLHHSRSQRVAYRHCPEHSPRSGVCPTLSQRRHG